jgi:hypothetical protein
MSASVLLIIVGPAACAVENTSVQNTENVPLRKAEIAPLNTSSQKNSGVASGVEPLCRARICFEATLVGYFLAPKVKPRPVVSTTLFFVLPGTGWLTYWSRKFAFAVNQPFNLVAIPAVKFMR